MKSNWHLVLIGKAGGAALLCWLIFATQANAALIPAGRLPGGSIWASNQVGVVGGIPNVTTIYANLSPSANDWGTINSALLTCPSNEVVYLNAGTYTITNNLFFGTTWDSWFSTGGHNGVVLRGAGPGKTILDFGGWQGIQVYGNNVWYSGPQTTVSTPLFGGYSQGSTHLLLTTNFSFAVGDMVLLTQENDPALVNISGTGSPQHIFTDINGRECNQLQWMTVTGVDSSGTNLTVWPGVYMTNYQAVLYPQVLRQPGRVSMIGVEDMTLNLVSGGIDFDNSYNCWVRNVETTNSGYAGVRFLYSAHGQVEGCYIHDVAGGGAAESYGVDPNGSSDILIQNNIFYKITAPLLLDSGSSGCVIAYNLCTNMIYGVSPGWMAPSFNTHGAHPSMNLFEGNMGTAMSFDIIHGSSSHNTVFRNDLYGYETNLNNYGPGSSFYINNTYCVSVLSSNRDMTFIGNVLGTDTYHINYEVSVLSYPTNYVGDNPTSPNIRSIYLLGYFGDYGGTSYQDPMTVTSLTRDGNYDYATHSVKWDDTPQTLPASLYLMAKPAWWSNSVPFPPIGSDLTPMVGTIPAQLRFAAMTAPTDPPPSQGSVPAPPSVLKVMGQ